MEDEDDDEEEEEEEDEEMGSSGEEEGGNDEKVDPETQRKELAVASKILVSCRQKAIIPSYAQHENAESSFDAWI